MAINQANLSRFRSNCDWDGDGDWDWGFPSILITKLPECVKPWENSCISINWNINFGAHVELPKYIVLYWISTATPNGTGLCFILCCPGREGYIGKARVSDHIQILIFHKSHMQTQTKSIPGGTTVLTEKETNIAAPPCLRLCTRVCASLCYGQKFPIGCENPKKNENKKKTKLE